MFVPRSSATVHSKLAHKCMEILRERFAVIDMEDLELDYKNWHWRIDPDLAYAIEHWAENVKLSGDASMDMLETILSTFSRNESTMEKWWLCYLQKYSISAQNIQQRHQTTILHLFAHFGFQQLLELAYTNKERRWRFARYSETTDCFEWDPLCHAIKGHHTEIVEFFIQHGVPISLRSTVAAAGSNPEIAKAVFAECKVGLLSGYWCIEILEQAVTSLDSELVSVTITFLRPYCEENVFL
jgi:hypothetical protein